ncbi:MAG TPA: nitroreductase family protein [Myxococcota bacterium]|nr:nitroreductase family protein [Myxococcota bacterium]
MREEPVFVPYLDRFAPEEGAEDAARRFLEIMRRRRSVREFSSRPVSRETIESLVRAAASAPSGANKQPWRFVCVQDAETKRRIRLGAEEEEREFYEKRAPEEWLEALAPLGTDAQKEFLEVAPWLIVVFRLVHDDDESQLYYTHESVGIACGFLLAAAQHAGLATLTHTPSPMRFLSEILGRPKHERPFLLIPVGYPAESCRVPQAALRKKPLGQVLELV